MLGEGRSNDLRFERHPSYQNLRVFVHCIQFTFKLLYKVKYTEINGITRIVEVLKLKRKEVIFLVVEEAELLAG